jgi:hypothetical protein
MRTRYHSYISALVSTTARSARSAPGSKALLVGMLRRGDFRPVVPKKSQLEKAVKCNSSRATCKGGTANPALPTDSTTTGT